MRTPATTRMSSRGQVVIPEPIRLRLRLQPGAEFVVVGSGDVVVLKRISPPSFDQFDDLIAQARREARKAGLKPAAIAEAIRKVRSRARQ